MYFLPKLGLVDEPAAKLNDHGLGLNILNYFVRRPCEDVDFCICQIVLIQVCDLSSVSYMYDVRAGACQLVQKSEGPSSRREASLAFSWDLSLC